MGIYLGSNISTGFHIIKDAQGNLNFLRGTIENSSTKFILGENANTISQDLKVEGSFYVGTLGTGDNSTFSTPSTIYFAPGAGDAYWDNCVIKCREYKKAEAHELLLYMGNDTGTLAGPDRIRLRAAEIRLDTYSVSVRNDASARIDEINLRLIVKSNGNVGINRVNPSQKLDVGGNIKASKFIGNGSTITNINANNITSGIVNNARLNEASTNLAGIVQLINSNTSTSTTRAPTANALAGVKAALNSEIGSTFFGNSGGDGFMRFPYGPEKYILVQWGQTEKKLDRRKSYNNKF